jgi:hypothetical protein
MINAMPWADRPHRGPKAEALELSPEEREKIEAIVRLPSTEQRVARRGQAVLLFADSVATADVAMLVGIDYRTARKWKKRFRCESPSEKLADAPRSGRPPSVCRPQTPRG